MIYLLADIHLCEHNWTDRKDIEGDSVSAFMDAANAIIKDDTDEDKHVILAGDIFDKKTADG